MSAESGYGFLPRAVRFAQRLANAVLLRFEPLARYGPSMRGSYLSSILAVVSIYLGIYTYIALNAPLKPPQGPRA